MEWTEGLPEEAAPLAPARAQLPAGVRADPPDFPVRNASAVFALPKDENKEEEEEPVRLLVSRFGDSALMVVATQLPTLGTITWLRCAPPAKA